jgi:hypothetical protein
MYSSKLVKLLESSTGFENLDTINSCFKTSYWRLAFVDDNNHIMIVEDGEPSKLALIYFLEKDNSMRYSVQLKYPTSVELNYIPSIFIRRLMSA